MIFGLKSVYLPGPIYGFSGPIYGLLKSFQNNLILESTSSKNTTELYHAVYVHFC